VPAAARKGQSGVHRRPAPPPPKKALPSKLGAAAKKPLPQAKLPPRPVIALRALPPPSKRELLRDHPPASHDEDEDTVVEMAGGSSRRSRQARRLRCSCR
jgi:hypothetical protein